MSETTALDFEAMLTPVEPAESNPREGAPYLAAREAYMEARRVEADEGERLQDLAIASNHAPWAKVKSVAIEYLTGTAVDMEVTGWLLEAMVRLHGFVGARDGLRLYREYAERCWDTVYPRPAEGEGDALRLAPLRALSAAGRGRMIFALKCVPLTPEGFQPMVSYLAVLAGREFEDFERRLASKELDSEERDRRREKRLAWLEGRTTAACASAIGTIPTERLLELRGVLQSVAEETVRLEEALSKCFAGDAEGQDTENEPPSLGAIREAIESIETELNAEISTRPDQNPAEDDPEGVGGDGGEGHGGGAMGREEILRQLERYADFFERTEPHSPLAPGLRRLARWGRTPLGSFYKEVFPEDETTRKTLARLIGLPTDEDGNF